MRSVHWRHLGKMLLPQIPVLIAEMQAPRHRASEVSRLSTDANESVLELLVESGLRPGQSCLSCTRQTKSLKKAAEIGLTNARQNCSSREGVKRRMKPGF